MPKVTRVAGQQLFLVLHPRLQLSTKVTPWHWWKCSMGNLVRHPHHNCETEAERSAVLHISECNCLSQFEEADILAGF